VIDCTTPQFIEFTAPRPNNDNRSGSAGNTQNKTGHTHSSDVVCYKCGKPGHISPNCPTNGPRVFAAHVIDEDAEDAPRQENQDQEGHDEKEDHTDPQQQDDGHESDPQEALIGSQYDSDQEGYPLDQYEESVEVDNYSDEDTDVLYI
jgi:hypothetical protein